MKRLTVLAVALVLGILAVAMFAGALSAQTSQDVYPTCLPSKAVIKAVDLPTVVDRDRCPVAGKAIVDSAGIGTHLPAAGESIFVEANTAEGNQVFSVSNPADGTFVLEDVGVEATSSSDLEPGTFTAQSIPNGCNDQGYNPDPANQGRRIIGNLLWEFNSRSTPNYMSVDRVESALQAAGTNVSHVHNPCGVGDGVGAEIHYNGRTADSVNIPTSSLTCPTNGDGRSVVGFGDLARLPDGQRIQAGTCRWDRAKEGYTQRDIYEVDTRMNKAEVDWTTQISSGCSGRWHVEAMITHERGHAFGMNHVDEGAHPYLTMSEKNEGPCQVSERSLGLGDARGLNEKYR